MTHIVLHNTHAAAGKGMEIYEVSDAKKMLDRVQEIFDGESMYGESKHLASLLIDGRIDEVFQKKNSILEVRLRSPNKTVYLYLATMGKATK